MAFLSYPAFKNLAKNRIPISDWGLVFVATFFGGYYFIFYNHIATLIGQPTVLYLTVGVLGIIVLLGATRRSLGLPLAIVAICFLLFNVIGPYLPPLIAHNANSLAVIVNQQWLTTEGVFGIA